MSEKDRAEIASRAGTTADYIQQLIYGHRFCSIELAEKLENEVGAKGAEEIVSKANRKILARLRAESNAA
jgi:hypothetical protein